MSSALQELILFIIFVLALLLLSWLFAFDGWNNGDDEEDERPHSSLVFAQGGSDTAEIELSTIQAPERAVLRDR
jgi:hypothetical protein